MSQLLEVSGVSVSFDGFRAINSLSFNIGDAELRAVIGPNGAGKTTFLDVVSGINPATSGDIALDGIAITNKKPDVICHLGISRTFQLNSGFETMSIRENTLVGASFGLGDKGWFPRMTYSRIMHERVERALELCSLQDRADLIVRDFPVLDRKILMMAGALATLEVRVARMAEAAADPMLLATAHIMQQSNRPQYRDADMAAAYMWLT